jgi:FtsH-binding integral membrane protein
MSYGQDYPLEYRYSAEAVAAERAGFIRRTYSHLAGAILAFMGIEAILLNIPGIEQNVFGFLLSSQYSWLLVLGAFMVVGWIAEHWARSQTSRSTQYLGLSLYVVAEALLCLPLLLVAKLFSKDPNIIPTAGILTLAVFGGLTMTVFITKKDFSFMGPVLSVCSWIAFGVILCAIIFQGFTLGMFFTLAMIALMAGWIIYYTSNVLHHFPSDMHVAAALVLFAAVATLFWYILRLLLIMSSRD